ncbi:hypothetical protein J2755_002074 [Methanohalophilus levihalophilus]|uniref:hypothetical protein n=1 Tax=Methanohalophilus levihalophilus TaxID=1431282 RepID=UPI001AE52027|nr:hypothetical protein [Methanohalophilus levihalophilus]MBP2031126.1 hypothetical protein [Methanohalophilus levihalophilus]
MKATNPRTCVEKKQTASLKEIAHAFTPYAINKYLIERKCKLNKQETIPKNNSLAVYPPSLNINRVVEDEIDKCIAFLPYCAKPRNDTTCPVSDTIDGRKNQKCLKLDGAQCKVPCSLGKMVDVLKQKGFTKDRIFIIDSDSNLFPWLKQKRSEGYEYFMPGIGCHYGVKYALDYVVKNLGFKGCVVFIEDYDPKDPKNGVCKTPSDYLNMEYGDKGKRTKIPNEAIYLMEKILDGSISQECVNYPERTPNHTPSHKKSVLKTQN